ncbi:MAG: acyl-CoA dehydratase activase, partial [Syntrophomonas sp.]|nr:acyl-CoA dehydratase activase [Syntrophomonas sp.]
WSPRETGLATYQGLLQELGHSEDDVDFVVGTGYGRISLPFVSKAITEITCHARGAAHLVNDSTMVIDIGGQDSKIIKIDQKGKVLDFVMNDKCAAGTGRFLQMIAAALGLDVAELSELSRGKTPLTLNSMCAVFAESEVIGLLAAGRDKGEIVAGLHQSIARRIASMAQRMGKAARITFTGGVARNEGLCSCLREVLGAEIIVPAECQLAGALGAALLARDYLS